MHRKTKLDAQKISDDPLWYKDAVIYELHVRAFYDGNGDGIGDFVGLTEKLDYLQDLGVDTLWVLPFYPSPMRDDGYDISDYRNVHPDYGTRRDFLQFVRAAHDRGLRVITELVINHTSDAHPWFQAARRAPAHSPKRDFYVWSDTVKKFESTRIIFTDSEKSNWAWDDMAKAYYWHRFFFHQPDLNHNNPRVVKAMVRIMEFWLGLGVDGLRLDAIPYLCVREGTSNENLPETHEVTRYMRSVIDGRYHNRMLLAEANQWPEDVRDYFGAGDECHMAYHFPLMPRMYMAIAQEDRHPIVEIMKQTPDIPESCQWAIFLRNHDELTLEMVTNKERDYMYQMYAADQKARLNLGIRRRLAPLMDNDFDKIRLMNSLLLSMPGSPIIYYGDEIGMGDNIYLGDRNGVRTPMQWSPDRNAGFSRADPQRLFLPPIMDPVYGFGAVNVEGQSRDPSSLLNWMRRLLSIRKGSKVFGRGSLKFFEPGNRKVLAYIRAYGDETVLCVANLSRSAQPVELDLSAYKGRVPVELVGRTPFPPIGDLPYLLTLHGHGFYWFRLAEGGEVPAWHEERLVPEELPLLVLFDGWRSLFRDRVVPWRIGMAEKVRMQWEEEALPRFMETQRWYVEKGEGVKRVVMTETAEWVGGGGHWFLTFVEVAGDAGPVVYFLPVSLIWENENENRTRGLLPFAIARVRQQATLGILGDAFADDGFCQELVGIIRAGGRFEAQGGMIQGVPVGTDEIVVSADDLVRRSNARSTNTSVAIGDHLFLKGYRHLRQGVNPEAEMGRFLSDVVHFPHAVPVLGTLEYQSGEGGVVTLALLQAYVENQGDGWDYTLNYLESHLELCLTATAPTLASDGEAAHGGYLALIRVLGQRTAQLHCSLARTTGHPDFDPEPLTAADGEGWVASVREEVEATFEMLSRRLSSLAEDAQADGHAVLAVKDQFMAKAGVSTGVIAQGLKTRYHGDYHLGQVLLQKNDFTITDFEGEPGRPLAARRQKHTPLRDVASMIRSFNYAMYTALDHVAMGQEEHVATLSPHARAWEGAVARAFLESYATETQGAGLWEDFGRAQEWVRLFLLEKACYELRYEMDNRPQNVSIPLRGLLQYLELELTAADSHDA
ncbi:MAG: maltose alpha-D-glucosyltransferase [Acidiferrobacter sp.]